VHNVLGDPFLEDVTTNWTSSKLRVTLFARPSNGLYMHVYPQSSVPLTLEEEVYSVFRPYGVVNDLQVLGDPVAAAGGTGAGACALSFADHVPSALPLSCLSVSGASLALEARAVCVCLFLGA
jgi:hypothetical protein